ncbi:uncharacterized protein [Centruroides vittatus]|uniref:uncharacterized protein n=1 Tax=Centruroides vittatus TaxID=120091 RepID=UPI0035109364
MGCGPSKPSRVSPQRASFCEEEEFGQNGDEVNTVMVNETGKNYPLSPGSKHGDVRTIRVTGSSKGRIGEKSTRPMPGPLVAQMQRTPSQIEFFKTLEEKINQGQDLEEAEGLSI